MKAKQNKKKHQDVPYNSIGEFSKHITILNIVKGIESSIDSPFVTDTVGLIEKGIKRRFNDTNRAKSSLARFIKKYKLNILDLELISLGIHSRKIELTEIPELIALTNLWSTSQKYSDEKILKLNAVCKGILIYDKNKDTLSCKRDMLPNEKASLGDMEIFNSDDIKPYKHIMELQADILFLKELYGDSPSRFGSRRHRHDLNINKGLQLDLIGVKKWIILEKIKLVRKEKNKLSRFIKKYELGDKEFIFLVLWLCCNDSLIREDDIKHFLRQFGNIDYDNSKLKNESLLLEEHSFWRDNIEYKLSMKARKELLNEKYTESDRRFDSELKNRLGDDNDLCRIELPQETFNELVLPEITLNKIKMAISQAKHNDKIFKDWALEKSIRYGKGITMNFCGVPGTGKTLAAKAIANNLNKKLLTVRYDQLQNKYVGETEKNISKIFEKAKVLNAVLFFDEADAIAQSRAFAVRSWEVSQVNVLLKELESFEGICIFATNFVSRYDRAFERRITMHINFENPDKYGIAKIFEKHFPKKNILSKDIDFSELAKKYSINGGDIKNVVLTAARMAAYDKDTKISMKHLEQACDIVINNKNVMHGNVKQKQAYMG